MNILKFFSPAPAAEPVVGPEKIRKTYNRQRASVFVSATLGYGLYYVCRLSINVIKKPIVDAGVLSESELGIIGTGLFVTYAVGKFANGFLADRSNIRRFLAAGLLVSALINLALGFTTAFGVYAVLWAINGWAQSMGPAPCVVSLSRWFPDRRRGTFYGLWSSSHNIGEALTFILTALIVNHLGWQWGFKGAGVLGLAGCLIIALFMRDSPQSCGLPPVAEYEPNLTEEGKAAEKTDDKSVSYYQKQVLRNPAIWMLALSSMFMYMSRYAVNSWGIFFLEAQKGYTNMEAAQIISISSVCGIIGTISCGWLSDRFFGGRRNIPALVFGLMNVLALILFLFGPESYLLDAVSMVIFGLAIGALICLLGGLMAVDIASKKASGAALGVVGLASYAGAALQDLISGFTIESGKSAAVAGEAARYDFSVVSWFWLGAAVLSVLCALTVWNARAKEA